MRNPVTEARGLVMMFSCELDGGVGVRQRRRRWLPLSHHLYYCKQIER